MAGALTVLTDAFASRGDFAEGTFRAGRLAGFLADRLAIFLALGFGPDDARRVIFGMIGIY
jgi:hypothetical protein